MRSWLPLIFLIAILAGTVGLFGWMAKRAGTEPTEAATNTAAPASRSEPRVTFIDPVRGNPHAQVTIVEFGDYFCQFCREMEPVVQAVLASYPETVRFVWKDVPNDYLHGDASRAAIAARCAGEGGKFWEYHDELMARTNPSGIISYTDLAASVGIDRAAFASCVEANRPLPQIAETVREAQALGLTGVPAFFINGAPFTGTTVDEFKTAINALLE